MTLRPGSGRAFVFVTLLAASACRQLPLPDVPEISVDGFAPAVRAEIQKALSEVRASPRDASANGRLGMVLHAHEQNASAEVCYQRAYLFEPNSFKWSYYLGLVQEAQGKNDEAIETFKRAVRLKADYTAAQLRLADLLFATGEVDDSSEIYERLVRTRPNLAPAHYGLGRVKSARGDTKGAIEALKKACGIFPGYGSAHYALAAAYRKIGDHAMAEFHTAAHSRASAAGPPREDPLESEVMALNAGATNQMSRGIALESAGRLAEAADAHERALEIDSKLTQAHINLISLYARMGQRELSERHYMQVIGINPNQADAHYNYGVMLFGAGRAAQAKDAFSKAIAANPRHAEAHNNLGYSLMEEGNLAAAERHFRKAIESKPDHRLAHFHLGRLLANRRNYRAAIAHFSNILEPEDDQTPRYTYALAATYARAGQHTKGLEFARIAREKAAALGQSELLASIERDIRAMERPK